MKSAFGSFFSLLLGAVAGYALFSVVAVVTGLETGRNPLPVAICAGVVLLASGYAYGRWLHASLVGSAIGVAAYVALVYAAVAYLGGTAGGIFVDWFVAALAVTIVPWLVGLALSRLRKRTAR